MLMVMLMLMLVDNEQVIAIKHIMPPANPRDFQDVYVVFPIMDTDLNQVIRSRQPLTEEHCQVSRLMGLGTGSRGIWAWGSGI
jgi:mitogen-activated protein kinase 1/3